MDQIINSILDTDLYKLTMQMAVVNKFPYAKVRYTFILRGDTKFPEGFGDELRRQLNYMENLKLSDLEKRWLQEKCPYLSPTFIDFLAGYQYDSAEIGIIHRGDDLEIWIEGYWYRTILWEVPVMALISEIYFKLTGEEYWGKDKRDANNNHKKQLFKLHNTRYADFGTRRRFSYEVHDELVECFADKFNRDNFVGTSNVHLAMKHNTTPIGTHAHEWFMFHAAKYGYKMANHLAMENWSDVFRGDLGIALPDTFTTDAFIPSFDKKFSKLYDGVRQDSGKPNDFTDKFTNHYDRMGIDRASKSIVYSDSLTTETAIDACDYGKHHKFKTSAGIGTHFTNDVGVKPINMVIKMVQAKPEGKEWTNTIKLGDGTGKHTGNAEEIQIAKYVLNIKPVI